MASGDRIPLGLRFARAALSGVEALSPSLAAGLVVRAMLRTRRRPVSTWERERLESGTELGVDGPLGRLVAQSWGHGPLVFLVHGWNGRSGQLGAFVAPLVDAGFQVVAFDAPGHGASSGSRSSIVEFADALELMVDTFRPCFRPIHGVIAHSLGAAAVAYALSRRGSRLVESEGGLRSGLLDARLVFIAPPIDIGGFAREVSDVLGVGPVTRCLVDGVIERRLGERLDDQRSLGIARGMRAPLLVLHDREDRSVPFDGGYRLARAWPGAKLRATSGLGHSRILRDPATVRAAVGFIRGDEA